MKVLLTIISMLGTLGAQQTFTYTLQTTKPRVAWGAAEKQAMQKHVAYLDSLTKVGKLKLAGVANSGQSDEVGWVILNVTNYKEALQLAKQDPAVKENLMTFVLKCFHVFFTDSPQRRNH